MVERLTARASGKLLLFGEHAAVYGYPAVGISLDRTLTVEVTPNHAWRFCFGEAAPCEDFGDQLQDFFPHLEAIAEAAGLAARAGSIRGMISVVSDLPIAAGFGSSAALCAALSQLLLPPNASTDDLWRIAHRLEAFFHGTASGIDTGLAVLSGTRVFRFDAEQEIPTASALRLPPMAIVYGAIPRETSTRELVSTVRRRMERTPTETKSVLVRLGEIADRVATGRIDSARSFATQATEAHGLLAKLGVSTGQLDRIIARGIDAGALGGKLSGAGGGGAFYLVCDRTETARAVIDALTPQVQTVATAPPALLQIKSTAQVDLP